jgi:hypothetical protein
MNPLPLPVRLAAGLVATAVEQARDLPRLVIEFPVTAVSQALQASMRVQQRVTELAIKGDRALGSLRPVEEKASWATFDEDEAPRGTNGASTVTELRPAPRRPAQRVTVDRTVPSSAAADTATPVAFPPASTSAPTPAESSAPAAPAPAAPAPAAPASAKPAAAPTPAAPTAPAEPTTSAAPTTPAPIEPTDPAAAVELIASAPLDEPATEPAESPLPGYGSMSIAQLRGKLRALSLDDLRALLAWEQTHEDRPAYVTMLSNRITTVSEA